MAHYNDHTYVHSPNDLPPGEHFLILTFGTITIPGDERSRTHPGHGYPESTEHTTTVVVYKTRAAWEEEIKRLTEEKHSYKSWVPLIARRPSVTTTVSVSVE